MEISSLAIASILAVVPALFWVFFFYKKDYRDPEPLTVIFRTFLAGMVAAIPFLVIRVGLQFAPQLNAVLTGLLSVILFAALEEMAKLVAAIFVVSRHQKAFNQMIDGVVYAVTAAIGFSFVENLFYFIQFINSGAEGWLSVFLFRSFGTMLAHILFSGLAGLIWAYAYFSKKISPFERKHILAFEMKDFINRELWSLHIIRHNVLRAMPSRRGGHEKQALVMEGMIAAVFLHSAFNLATAFSILGHSITFLLIPCLMAGLFVISLQFTKKLNVQILKVV